jgi:nitrous oxidase accessory protein NosD
MTSRVRCSCGRVYDPQKHTTCPDCGAESAVESVVVAEKIKPPVPPSIEPELKRDDERKAGSFAQLLRALPWPVYAAVALLALIILFFALRPRPPVPDDEESSRSSSLTKKTKEAKHDVVSVHEESSLGPSVAPSPSATTAPFIPSSGYTVPSGIVMGGVNLGELIARAKAGETVTVPAGLYPGGLTIDHPVHIVADSRGGGQVVIQSEGKESLSVRSKGVTIQNIQFWCKGIGDLPAVSVADGAELEMEGCKIQSGSGLGLSVSNASIKTLGSTFNTPSGIAVLVNGQAHASFTQSTFLQSQIGLGVQSGATAELHSCAFEGIGMGAKDGAIIVAAGENTQVTGTDCHFTNNTVGMGAREKASLSLTTCTFKGNALDSRSSGLVVLRDAQVAIRKTSFVDASPYAVNVMSNATLTLDETEISGSRAAGLVIGERNASPAHAEIKHSRFNRNAIGVGIVAGSSAEIEDSECSENNEGILVLEQGSRLKLRKTAIVSNRNHGLQVYANAEVTVIDSDIRNNARGALSGVPHKASQHAALTIEDCRIGGNQVFGVGACAQSQLILTRCVFEQDSKKNIYRESGAIVQMDTGSELTPSPEEAAEATPSPESTAKTKSGSRHTTRTRPRQQDEDAARDISRIIRRWVPNP